MLATMLEPEAEVSGFLNFEEIKVTFLPAVQAPLKQKWVGREDSGFTHEHVEWMY